MLIDVKRLGSQDPTVPCVEAPRSARNDTSVVAQG
jgi:hypothetical protein